MIKRYTRKEMAKIWTLESRFGYMLDVELSACKAMNKLGIIPDEDLKIILEKADFDVERIAEIEKETKHDVIAFLTNVAEYVGKPARWIHYGLTSSDILDTATSLQLRDAGNLIYKDMIKLSEVLKHQAIKYKNQLCVGRSHGIHAEPTSFGLKFALWYDELQRDIKRMQDAIDIVSVGQLSGAVGNYAHISPEIEKYACEDLNLKPVNISTQIIQRDRIIQFLSALAMTASLIEKIAIELRHLQRTEVLEVEENFGQGQKGSSAMPHKKNPITAEQLSGLSRLVRSNLSAAFENNPLWHERDISHSSVERIILPDTTILINYMLYKTTNLVENLLIYPENMIRNLELTNGLVFSQTILLELSKKGISREKAYKIIQRNAMECWETKEPFKDLLKEDRELTNLISEDEIDTMFDYERFLKNVDYIYKRVGIKDGI